MITGAKLIIVSREVTADGIELAKSLEHNQATIMQATPATWRLLITAGCKGNQRLKVICGGEALDINFAEKLLERSEKEVPTGASRCRQKGLRFLCLGLILQSPP